MTSHFRLKPLCISLALVTCAHAKTPTELVPKLNQYYQPVTNSPERKFCSGVWVKPAAMHPEESKLNVEDQPIHAKADNAYFMPNQVASMSGNVQISRGAELVEADQIEYNLENATISTQGNLKLQNNQLIASSEAAQVDLTNEQAKLSNTEFVSLTEQAHGKAKQLEQIKPNHYELEQASYTTCEPQNPTWRLEADTISLNSESGRGEATGAAVKIKDVTVLKVPYLNFPIDDRRLTGFLAPRFGLTNSGGVDASVPFYWNIRPELDAVITPRVLTKRGGMLEVDTRYLFESAGQTELSVEALPKDSQYNNESRHYVFSRHEWNPSLGLKAYAEYREVSDPDYFTDLSGEPAEVDELYLPRGGYLEYTNPFLGLDASASFEGFQVVDPTLPDKDKPYTRLPQISLTHNTIKGQLIGSTTADLGYFTKRIDDQSANENSGVRLYASQKVGYEIGREYGHLKTTVGAATLNSWYDNEALEDQGLTEDERFESVTLPLISLDAGLSFEKLTPGLSHQLEPRVFYAYRPYKNQDNLPSFDTIYANQSLDLLFQDSRFIGYDRIDNINQLSMGLNYNLINQNGFNAASFSVARAHGFEERKVTLNTQASGPKLDQMTYARARVKPSETLDAQLDTALEDTGNLSFYLASLIWQPKGQTTVSFNHYNRESNQNLGQFRYRASSAALVTPVGSQTSLLGLAQYNHLDSRLDDLLIGLSYESCCYRATVFGRNYYNNITSSGVDQQPERQIMLEITLKGLMSDQSRLKQSLTNRIVGYQPL